MSINIVESSPINIHLIPHDTKVLINKDEWKQFYPDSMITRAFELDTEARVILIEQDFITPDIINYLNLLIMKKEIVLPLPEGDLSKAGDYLGISILQVIGSPLYEHEYIGKWLSRGLFKDQWNSVKCGCLIISASQRNYSELLQYIIDHIPPDDTNIDIYRYGFEYAVKFGASTVIPLYLKYVSGVLHTWYSIYDASERGYLDIVKMLILSNKVDWNNERTRKCFDVAIRNEHIPVALYWCEYMQSFTMKDLEECLESAVLRGKTQIAVKLLQDPRLNTDIHSMDCMAGGHSSAVKRPYVVINQP